MSLIEKEKPAAEINENPPQPNQNDLRPKEHGGRKNGLDPTRYDDWEKDGRAVDF